MSGKDDIRSGNDDAITEKRSPSEESTVLSREEWHALKTDPDVNTDLGYDILNWEQIETLDKTEQIIFLPDDESEIKDNAFIVAEKATVVDLEKRY